MQTIVLGQTNRVFLNTQKIVTDGKLTITDSTGSFINDDAGNPLVDKVTSVDVATNRHYFDVTLEAGTPECDIYLYWVGTTASINVILEPEFDPEDGEIKEKYSTDVLLVSPTYVMDHYLRGIGVDESQIASSFKTDFRDVLRNKIYASTEFLQTKIDVHFTLTTITDESHDFYIRSLYDKYWTQQLYHSPVNSVSGFRLMFNDQEVGQADEAWLQIGNKDEGLIKVVPYSSAGSGLLITLITQLALGLGHGGGDRSYIPDFFHYDYVAGLDWKNLPKGEREDIKDGIARFAAIGLLPNLDENRGISSESKSIDGASSLRSYTSSATFGEHSAAIAEYQKQHDAWLKNMKKKYMRILQTDGFG